MRSEIRCVMDPIFNVFLSNGLMEGLDLVILK